MELRFPPCASAQSPWLPSGTLSTPSWPLTCFPAMPPADPNPSRGGAEPRGPQARTCITPPWAPGPGTPLSQPSLGPSLGTLGNMHQPMDQDPGHCGLAVHAGHWGLVRWPHVSMVDRLVSSLLPMMEDSEGQAGGVVWAQSGRLCLVQHQVPWLGALGLMAPGPHTRTAEAGGHTGSGLDAGRTKAFCPSCHAPRGLGPGWGWVFSPLHAEGFHMALSPRFPLPAPTPSKWAAAAFVCTHLPGMMPAQGLRLP